eukprot:4894662-Amphidinium_carterae.1
MSAKLICNICHFAEQAGAVGLSDLSKGPSASASNAPYNFQVDRYLQEHKPVSVFEEPAVQSVKNKQGRKRVVKPLYFYPPHIMVANYSEGEIAEIKKEFLNKVRLNDLPLAYWNHPIVKKHAGTGVCAIPMSLYLDGIRHGRKDSIL